MSGGHFDYIQFRLDEIAQAIKEVVYNPKDHEVFSEETIREFKKGIKLLKQAQIYSTRIDWLLSGDDGEESFHKRLKEDLDKLNWEEWKGMCWEGRNKK